MSIRVLICDDQDLVREGLQAILGTAAGIEVVGVAQDGAQALELISDARPDVVLMDLKMPGMNGIQATRLIGERHPGVRVLALTTYDADEWVFDAIRSGAAGYLLKDTPREQLVTAITGTAQGQTHVDPNVAGKLFARLAQAPAAPADTHVVDDLSERERAVLALLARGLRNADIATQLFVSETTVKAHLRNINTKLQASSRTNAVALARQYGLID